MAPSTGLRRTPLTNAMSNLRRQQRPYASLSPCCLEGAESHHRYRSAQLATPQKLIQTRDPPSMPSKLPVYDLTSPGPDDLRKGMRRQKGTDRRSRSYHIRKYAQHSQLSHATQFQKELTITWRTGRAYVEGYSRPASATRRGSRPSSIRGQSSSSFFALPYAASSSFCSWTASAVRKCGMPMSLPMGAILLFLKLPYACRLLSKFPSSCLI